MRNQQHAPTGVITDNAATSGLGAWRGDACNLGKRHAVFGSGAVGLTLQACEAELYILKFRAQGSDLLDQFSIGRKSDGCVAGLLADVRALALARHDQAGTAQYFERSLDRLDGDAVLIGKRPMGQQLIARGEVAPLNLAADCGGNAKVCRPRIVKVVAIHAGESTSKASQDGAASVALLSELSKTAKLSMFSSLAGFPAITAQQQEAPASAATPVGAHIETLGETMQVERTRLYRVRTVADSFDVSVATIYRAVESGALRAIRLGTGKGAVRIPGDALVEYLAACESAAVTRAGQPADGEVEGFAAGGAA